jgi:hypothetical protein
LRIMMYLSFVCVPSPSEPGDARPVHRVSRTVVAVQTTADAERGE